MFTTFAHAGHDHAESEYQTIQEGSMSAHTSAVDEADFSPLPIVVGGAGAMLVIAVLVVATLRKQPKAVHRTH